MAAPVVWFIEPMATTAVYEGESRGFALSVILGAFNRIINFH